MEGGGWLFVLAGCCRRKEHSRPLCAQIMLQCQYLAIGGLQGCALVRMLACERRRGEWRVCKGKGAE